MANPFVNRIVGYSTKPADQFLANPLNFRTHPQRQRDAVQASLRELGWIGVVVENRTTGRLIDGHERVWQALKGNEPVPYIEVELSEAEEKLALAVFDPITYMAETDTAVLDALLREVNTGEDALQELLAGLAEENGLYQDTSPIADAKPQIDKAAELQTKWQTATGQLWQLGDHRLICGDCTDADVVARVMGGEKAAFCFTDPPYGVAYTGGTKKWAMLENDDEVNMYAASLPLIHEFTEPKAALYLAFASANARSVYNSIADAGYIPRALLIWAKNHAQFGAMGSQYKQKHEPIAYCYKDGQAPHWFGPNNEVTVWDIDRASANEYHPTQKPVDLYTRAMQNSAPPSCIVYEPFSGSGTSIIACEQLGRKCRAVEISPAYVAVAIERWADATSKTPVLVN